MSKTTELLRLKDQVKHLKNLLRHAQVLMKSQDTEIHRLEERLATSREKELTLLLQLTHYNELKKGITDDEV